MNEPRKFAPHGPLALEPRAFGMFLLMPYQPVTAERDGVTVLSIRGPLMQFSDPFCESYEEIVARVAGALSATPRAIVLSISSPGGVAAGCFEASAKIRSMCAAAGIPLVSYIDGQACSAAYALACAAPKIVASPTSMIGSIGVIAEVVDASAANAIAGVAVRMLGSGARKADGNPNVLVGGPALSSMQRIVDRLADEFFAFVGAARGIDADAVRALDAACFIGSDAQSMSLTDGTQTLDELVASIGGIATTVAGPSAPESAAEASAKGPVLMSKAFEDCIAALRKCAQGDDEEAAAARRMLQAELAGDGAPKPDEPDGDEPKPAPAPDSAKAEFPPKKEDEEAKALKADVAALKASESARQAQAVALERASLIASRPDFSAEHVATLAKATTPIELVREQVASIPRGLPRKPAAAAAVTGTRGEGQGDGTFARQAPEAASAMARAMGLEQQIHTGVIDNGNVLILGATLPKKAS